ncbi:MAG TPA: phage baseplate assembly protein V [Bryobacteraceae bacterium]|nr:phage baseplate assembly protein V [Bryobacteraceae bacterium]
MQLGTDEILARLIERVENRYFGKYRGHVTDNSDPNNLGRVKAKVPRVLGDEETGWALPAFSYGGASEQGFFAVPDIGAGVWIEFEGGDLSYPVWTGTWYTSGAIPESAQPAQKVLKTKSGHKIVLDDDAGSLTITDSNDNTIAMDSSSIQITAGNATQIVIDAPQIQIVNGSTHPLVFGDSLLQYLTQIVQIYQTHMHPGQTAGPVPVTPMPPTPPMQPPDPSLLSTIVTTG